MNTFQLECFLAVSKFLNFARASEQMNISQPAMTHQIQALEEELHVKLFHRTTRMVELTDEGLAFLPDAMQIVSITHNAQNRFSYSDTKPVIRLSVGCSTYLTPQIMVDAFCRLRQLYPNVHPLLHRWQEPLLFERLKSGSLDLVIHSRLTVKTPKEFHYKEILKSSLICMGLPDFFPKKPSIINQEDLKDLPLILYSPSTVFPETTNLQQMLSEGKRPDQLYFCENIESIIFLTKAGYGISVIPDIFIPDARSDLCCIPLNIPRFSFGVYFHSKTREAVVKDFIQILMQVCR